MFQSIWYYRLLFVGESNLAGHDAVENFFFLLSTYFLQHLHFVLELCSMSFWTWKMHSKVDIRIWNVKQPASICVHLGFGKNQFQALKEFGTINQCCSLRNEFYFIFACRNKSMEKHWRHDFALHHQQGFVLGGSSKQVTLKSLYKANKKHKNTCRQRT